MLKENDVLWAVQAPEMSEALLVEADRARTPKGITAQVALHVLRQWDVMIDLADFVCVEVDADTPQGIDLFEEVER